MDATDFQEFRDAALGTRLILSILMALPAVTGCTAEPEPADAPQSNVGSGGSDSTGDNAAGGTAGGAGESAGSGGEASTGGSAGAGGSAGGASEVNDVCPGLYLWETECAKCIQGECCDELIACYDPEQPCGALMECAREACNAQDDNPCVFGIAMKAGSGEGECGHKGTRQAIDDFYAAFVGNSGCTTRANCGHVCE